MTLTGALMLVAAGEALALDSLSVSSSPGAQATVPMTIGAQGATAAPSALRVFVQQGGGDCAHGPTAAADESAKSTASEVIAQSPSGSFSYAASYTPPVSGSYAICAYVNRASADSDVSSEVSQTFVAAAAPPPPAPSTTSPGNGTASNGATTPSKEGAKKTRCVVPKLSGRTYTQARTLIHHAGCIVGAVSKPSPSRSRPLHKGGRRRVLTVSHQITKPGKVLKARGRVSLVLKYVTPKASKKR
jgi:hypothetical protein